ncbi:Uncharacterised protein [Burkholderia pseudomallei]|nr:Uncharacterised protein [Burkholderia pseudomallei]VCT44949.1 Uncharacterised protein [Burkholderia pseudomallei]VCT49820.1 Uncharacterised protein [Burkholderia pseudomallei]VCT59351.1 Uncharacterised protein [Burkholderia pseudomallei]VCT71482.1 Uncharacterised protein [Burkholderia pseudomallei]
MATNTDWVAIEEAYRAGVDSDRQLTRTHIGSSGYPFLRMACEIDAPAIAAIWLCVRISVPPGSTN